MVTVELWFRKFVEQVVRGEPDTLVSGRAGFINAAWRMQLSKEEAEARLDEYAASGAPVPGGEVVRQVDAEAADDEASGQTTHSAALTGQPSPIGVEGSFNVASSERLVGHPSTPESFRRAKSLRMKFGVAIACASAPRGPRSLRRTGRAGKKGQRQLNSYSAPGVPGAPGHAVTAADDL